jgi:hypothetical protein|tara:strand:+ start:198 stop:308 length:111 start_codon:yes stop_codon:yes gene_type:complete
MAKEEYEYGCEFCGIAMNEEEYEFCDICGECREGEE